MTLALENTTIFHCSFRSPYQEGVFGCYLIFGKAKGDDLVHRAPLLYEDQVNMHHAPVTCPSMDVSRWWATSGAWAWTTRT